MDGVFLGTADRLVEHPLQLEAALGLFDRQAEAARELGEFVELERLGVGMRPPEKADLVFARAWRRPPRWPPA